MPGRVLRMTAREVERLLRQHGFQLISQKGSHRKWRHLETNVQVIVPEHPRSDIAHRHLTRDPQSFRNPGV